MIRGAGRLRRLDERALHHTPGQDRVLDGRHLLAQPDADDEDAARKLFIRQFFAQAARCDSSGKVQA